MDRTADMDRTRGRWRPVVLIVGLLLTGCGPVERRPVDSPEVLAEFGFDPNAPWVSVPVTLAGQQYRFILDTGSTHTICDASLEDRLGKRFLWPWKGTAARGKSFTYEYFCAPPAILGPLRIGKGDLIAVADLAGIGTALEQQVGGLLGMDFLRDYVVQIDFERASVTFLNSRKGTDRTGWGTAVRIKHKFLSSLPYIDGRVDGFQATFLVDTGWARRPAVGELAGGAFDRARSKSGSGTLQASVTSMAETNALRREAFALSDRFRVADFVYEDIVFYEGYESILGMRFFFGHVVTFDFPARRLYLKRLGDIDVSSPVELRLEGLGLTVRSPAWVAVGLCG